VDTDAEHEEDHTDLGELGRDRRIRAEARGERTDGDAGSEVADDRGKPQLGGEEAAKESRAEGDRDREDQAVGRH